MNLEGPVRANPMHAAQDAGLVYVTDDRDGLKRRRVGKGFRYLNSDGSPLTDAVTLARIKSLVIPPAWTDVWICPSPDGHLQVTGRDQKGRKQYRYHEQWSAVRDGAKYSSLIEFGTMLARIRKHIDTDLRRRGTPRERVLASIVWLLDNTMIRIGNAAYAQENGSFGLTTLRSRHVEIKGAKVQFAFKGKSGQQWKLQLVDRRIARILRSIQELSGQNLFQYFDEDGSRRTVSSTDVNAYLRELGGAAFTSKHFRTWGGTVRALHILARTERPESERARNKTLNAAVDDVAMRLGNTRAVCRKCYIHPAVIESWREGRLSEEVASLPRRNRAGLDVPESLTLRWLEKFA